MLSKQAMLFLCHQTLPGLNIIDVSYWTVCFSEKSYGRLMSNDAFCLHLPQVVSGFLYLKEQKGLGGIL